MKPWWDTAAARKYGFEGRAVPIIARRIAYLGHQIPANDRDHLKW